MNKIFILGVLFLTGCFWNSNKEETKEDVVANSETLDSSDK